MSSFRKKSASYLTDHTGYWLRMISNQVSHSFARKLESSQVTVAEWVILREMYENKGSTSPSTIADLTGLTRGAVSKLVARLLEKGLVSCKESTSDRRYQEIELTAKASSLVPKLASLADTNEKEFFSVLSAKELSLLNEILKKLATSHKLNVAPIN